ncbi:sigma-70 family RNA polymerase sigma factor [Streptomyces sp. NPDC050610]|uniref:RNA polymerase sigma factor n=1 Tax=Streptomyces sp. NPDC050610 TaxID=3157097 RepID=UPI003422B612
MKAPPARYEPFLDGLFTYCLSVLCEHDAATAVLGEVLALAERRGDRCPDGEVLRRPWLYALARWTCLRKLAELNAEHAGHTGHGGHVGHTAHTERAGHPANGAGAADADRMSEAAAGQRQRELARLAWPEAAGTSSEQREALELAVRHRLSPAEVATVLRMEHGAARALLSAAACEVERTRTALAVVELGNCQVVARLAEDTQVLLGTALRSELVRHVDECGECRRTAERATAGGPWPGTVAAAAALPVLEAPRPAAHAAMQLALRARPARGTTLAGPRFDRSGFPMAPKDRAARRRRMRNRAVTTTVVATVVAAPVLALWAAYRGAPETGEGQDGAASVTARSSDGLDGRPYEKAGNVRNDRVVSRFPAGSPSPGVTVEVTGSDGRPLPGASRAPGSARGGEGADGDGGRPTGAGSAPGRPGPAPGPGRLTVDAQPSGGGTAVTLTASGGRAVRWSASADAPWLSLSESSGSLEPGQSVTITVAVDHEREPAGPWKARIAVAPAGAVITVEGRGRTPTPTPTPPSPSPTTPTPTPSSPAPSVTPAGGG